MFPENILPGVLSDENAPNIVICTEVELRRKLKSLGASPGPGTPEE